MKSPLPALLGLSLLATASAAKPTPDPRKLDDPDALRESVPALAAQRFWKEFATPAEIALFDGPETVYPGVPKSAHDLTGFDPTLLGSKVPPPGVHPRILFSPEDRAMLKTRIDASALGRKARRETADFLKQTLFNPASDEGKIFAQLAAGDTADLRWELPPPDPNAAPTAPPPAPDHWFVGYKKTGGSSVHTAYLPNLLAAAMFQCWLDGDEKRGREVATATANYFRLREPVIARLAAELHDQQLAPKDYWRSVFGQIGGNNLAFCYDLGAPWMTDDQRAVMRRCVALATSGRLAYGMNGPARWTETNWTAWDLEHYVTALAIEGEEGFDPSIPIAAKRTLEGYLQWGINANGTIFESNGKNGGGFHYAMLSAIAMARRGDNLFGHPHLRKLPTMLVQSVVPSGEGSVDVGTWSSKPFGEGHFFVNFFPQDPRGDFLLRRGDAASAPAAKTPTDLKKITLLTPAHLLGPTPYICVDPQGSSDPKATAAQRRTLGLPLDFIDPTHGLLLTRSGDDADALFLMFEARADLSTVGHQQHSAGHFYLASDGEMWAVKASPKSAYSVDHNVVRIDGQGLADVGYPPRVRFVGASASPDGALATAEITNAYNRGWVNPTQFQWTLPEAKTWTINVETDPDVVAFFRGTQRYKMRLWGDNFFKQNWGPTMRVAAANPVKSAFRTAGLVRGKHPYALVLDDTDKGDGREHLYEWVMQVPSSVRLAEITLPKDNPTSAVLVKTPGSDNWRAPNVQPAAKGTPALLIVLLDVPLEAQPQLWNFFRYTEQPFRLESRTYAGTGPGEILARTKLFVSRRADVLRSRIALIPFRIGDEIPTIRWDPETRRTTLRWRDQEDTLEFSTKDAFTRVTVRRDGREVVASPADQP